MILLDSSACLRQLPSFRMVHFVPFGFEVPALVAGTVDARAGSRNRAALVGLKKRIVKLVLLLK
jgi:hypothetical protein